MPAGLLFQRCTSCCCCPSSSSSSSSTPGLRWFNLPITQTGPPRSTPHQPTHPTHRAAVAVVVIGLAGALRGVSYGGSCPWVIPGQLQVQHHLCSRRDEWEVRQDEVAGQELEQAPALCPRAVPHTTHNSPWPQKERTDRSGTKHRPQPLDGLPPRSQTHLQQASRGGRVVGRRGARLVVQQQCSATSRSCSL